jgi:hypothetical protein
MIRVYQVENCESTRSLTQIGVQAIECRVFSEGGGPQIISSLQTSVEFILSQNSQVLQHVQGPGCTIQDNPVTFTCENPSWTSS